MKARVAWEDLKKVYDSMEEKKQIEDLKGMSADDIIKVRTGFGNVEDA